MSINLGIDASNIRQGGGVTHLSRLLSAVDPKSHAINRITVWGSISTLDTLPDESWLDKRCNKIFERGLVQRLAWQNYSLPKELSSSGCDILFSPGGSLPAIVPIPSVTMSQNMLPFEPDEARLFGKFDFMRLKMSLLRLSQSRSFKKADGLIFLSDYAREQLSLRLNLDKERTALIPHGIEKRFYCAPRKARTKSDISAAMPFRLLYVSITMPYKHQLEVGRAILKLRNQGVPVSIDFAGELWGSYGEQVRNEFQRLDPTQSCLKLLGPIPFEQLHELYSHADGFLFASSCENLPNILIESMAAGLPIMCSDRGPMPEVLGDAGFYFDPYSTESIVGALKNFMSDASQRETLANRAYLKASQYSWTRCAVETFSFIEKIAQKAAH